MATFSDQIESIMKGFMNDFSVSGKNFKNTLRIWISSPEFPRNTLRRSVTLWSEKKVVLGHLVP